MAGGFLIFVIITPMALVLMVYRCFFHGNFPCVNTSNVDNINQVFVEE